MKERINRKEVKEEFRMKMTSEGRQNEGEN